MKNNWKKYFKIFLELLAHNSFCNQKQQCSYFPKHPFVSKIFHLITIFAWKLSWLKSTCQVLSPAPPHPLYIPSSGARKTDSSDLASLGIETATNTNNRHAMVYSSSACSETQNDWQSVRSIHNSKWKKTWTQRLWLSPIYSFLSVTHTVFSVTDLQHIKESQVNPQFKVNTVILIVCDTPFFSFCEQFRMKWR